MSGELIIGPKGLGIVSAPKQVVGSPIDAIRDEMNRTIGKGKIRTGGVPGAKSPRGVPIIGVVDRVGAPAGLVIHLVRRPEIEGHDRGAMAVAAVVIPP